MFSETIIKCETTINCSAKTAFDTFCHVIEEEVTSHTKEEGAYCTQGFQPNPFIKKIHSIFQISKTDFIVHVKYVSPLLCGYTETEQDLLLTARSDPAAGVHAVAVRSIDLGTLGGRDKETKKRVGRKRRDEPIKNLVDHIAPSGLVFVPDVTAPYNSCKLVCVQHFIGVNKAYSELGRYTGLVAGLFCDSVALSLERAVTSNFYLNGLVSEAAATVCVDEALGWTMLYQGQSIEFLGASGSQAFCLRGCCIADAPAERLMGIATELGYGGSLPGTVVHGTEEYPGGVHAVHFTYDEKLTSLGLGEVRASYYTRGTVDGSVRVSLKASCLHFISGTDTLSGKATQVELLPSLVSYTPLGPQKVMMSFALTVRVLPCEHMNCTIGALTQAAVLAVYGASLMYNTGAQLMPGFPTLALGIHSAMQAASPVPAAGAAAALDGIILQVLGHRGDEGYPRFQLLAPRNIIEGAHNIQGPTSYKPKSRRAFVPHVLSYQPLLFHPFSTDGSDEGSPEVGDYKDDDNVDYEEEEAEAEAEEANPDRPTNRGNEKHTLLTEEEEEKGKWNTTQETQNCAINTVLRAPKREEELEQAVLQVPQAPPQMIPSRTESTAHIEAAEDSTGDDKPKSHEATPMYVAPNSMECAREDEAVQSVGSGWTGPSLLEIPNNVLALIASYLPSKSAVALSHTCRRLHELVWGSNIVCQLMVLKEFGWISYLNKPECRPVTQDVFRTTWEIGHNWRHSRYTCTSVNTQRSNHTSSVRALLYIPEFGRLYSGASDTKVKVWTLSTQQSPSVLTNERVLGGPNAGALTLDWFRGHLFSGYSSGTVRVWDSTEDGQIFERQCVEQATLAADGFLFYHPNIIIWKESKAYVWNEIKRSVEYEFGGHTRKITSVKHFPIDRPEDTPFVFMSSSCDKKIMVWDVRTQEPPATLHSHGAGVTCLEPIGIRHFASGSNDKKIMIWDSRNMSKALKTFENKERITCLRAQNSILLSGAQDKVVRAWSINSMSLMHEYTGHSSPITCIECDGRFMASASTDGDIRLWDFLPH